jgi:hypothetical protein
MQHGKNGRLQPDRKAIDVEIARLRDLDVGALRARWHARLKIPVGTRVEPPPFEWTPVVGSRSQEVSDGRTSAAIVYG